MSFGELAQIIIHTLLHRTLFWVYLFIQFDYTVAVCIIVGILDSILTLTSNYTLFSMVIIMMIVDISSWKQKVYAKKINLTLTKTKMIR